MGLIVNRPLELNLTDLLSHLEIPSHPSNKEVKVYEGGPVQTDRGFVLHKSFLGNPWLSTHQITDDIYLTTSLDILEALAQTNSGEALVALGHAGWGPGQLEKEISDNVWLSCPSNSDIMFNMPASERMQAAAAMLGINLNLLTAHSGHA